MTALPEVLEKLEPCPWCGETPEVGEAGNEVHSVWQVFCKNHQCAAAPATEGLTRAEAITAWNTRPALLRDAGDAARMDWLCSMAVEVRTPLRYGSAHLFHAQTDNDEGEVHRTTLRQQIDAAMHAPGGAG